MTRYIFGLQGLLAILAFTMGISSIVAMVMFLFRLPFVAPLSVPVGLVVLVGILVVVVGALWLNSISYWKDMRRLQSKYWDVQR